MASKRVTSSAVNWSELYLRCPKHQLEQFKELKSKTDNAVIKISSLPASMPPINWDHYKTVVPIPGLVDRFKKEYESLNISYPKDTMDLAGKVKANGQTMTENGKRFTVSCEKLKTSAQKMKSALSKLPPLDELTPEITMAYFPLTNLDPLDVGEAGPVQQKSVLQKKVPSMHWDFN